MAKRHPGNRGDSGWDHHRLCSKALASSGSWVVQPGSDGRLCGRLQVVHLGYGRLGPLGTAVPGFSGKAEGERTSHFRAAWSLGRPFAAFRVLCWTKPRHCTPSSQTETYGSGRTCFGGARRFRLKVSCSYGLWKRTERHPGSWESYQSSYLARQSLCKNPVSRQWHTWFCELLL